MPDFLSIICEGLIEVTPRKRITGFLSVENENLFQFCAVLQNYRQCKREMKNILLKLIIKNL